MNNLNFLSLLLSIGSFGLFYKPVYATIISS